MAFALIENDVVVEIFNYDTLEDRFPDSIIAQSIEIPVGVTVEEGDYYHQGNFIGSQPTPHHYLSSGAWAMDMTAAREYLKDQVNERRAEIEKGGVKYTHTTEKTYQTGAIPHCPGRNYEDNYLFLKVLGTGGSIKAADNTSDTFTDTQVGELLVRVQVFAGEIQTDADALKAEADAVTDAAGYDAVVAKIEGTDDWPTIPYPAS